MLETDTSEASVDHSGSGGVTRDADNIAHYQTTPGLSALPAVSHRSSPSGQ